MMTCAWLCVQGDVQEQQHRQIVRQMQVKLAELQCQLDQQQLQQQVGAAPWRFVRLHHSCCAFVSAYKVI
jgi:hypothetical protein